MLTYKQKVDLGARLREVDAVVVQWRSLSDEVGPELRQEFQRWFQVSLIFHDAAIEGSVITHSEINAAIDPSIISDASLIPCYERIQHFHDTCAFAREIATSSRRLLTLETVGEINGLLHGESITGRRSGRFEGEMRLDRA